MGGAHGHLVLSDEDQANLETAKQLWERLRSIPGLSTEDAFIHLLSIIKLAELLHMTDRRDRRGVFDVLCCGVTDSASVIGASSSLRKHLVSSGVAKHKLCQNVGAFDDSCSRLEKDAHVEDPHVEDPPLSRPLQSCAEHVVYEKLGRLGLVANTTYAVQKVDTKKQPLKFKVVKRCANCVASGGEASDSGAFGRTPRLGEVVTDHPSLVDLPVPVINAPVMAFIRHVIRDFNSRSRSAIERRFPNMRVWRNLDMEGEHRVVSLLSDNDDDLDGLFNHVHDEL